MIAIWDDHEFSDDSWRDHQTYNNANTTMYQAVVTVRDARGASVSANVAVTSATITGTFVGTLQGLPMRSVELSERELHDGLLLLGFGLVVIPLVPHAPLPWLHAGADKPRPQPCAGTCCCVTARRCCRARRTARSARC